MPLRFPEKTPMLPVCSNACWEASRRQETAEGEREGERGRICGGRPQHGPPFTAHLPQPLHSAPRPPGSLRGSQGVLLGGQGLWATGLHWCGQRQPGPTGKPQSLGPMPVSCPEGHRVAQVTGELVLGSDWLCLPTSQSPKQGLQVFLQ